MITKNFIKQCEQAEELQAWYKSDVKNVREGDRYICRCDTCKENMFVNYVKDSDIDYINERDITDVDPTYAAMVSLSGVGEFGAFWDDGGFIWLPAQERLQEMILKIFSPFAKIIKFSEFVSNYVKLYRDTKYEDLYWRGLYPTAIESMNELWLMYVMYEKYHKIWTGEKWVKAND